MLLDRDIHIFYKQQVLGIEPGEIFFQNIENSCWEGIYDCHHREKRILQLSSSSYVMGIFFRNGLIFLYLKKSFDQNRTKYFFESKDLACTYLKIVFLIVACYKFSSIRIALCLKSV